MTKAAQKTMLETAFWFHHQCKFGSRGKGQCRTVQLCGFQGRYQWLHQKCGTGTGFPQHSLQCSGTGNFIETEMTDVLNPDVVKGWREMHSIEAAAAT